jgi:phosphopantothenoylcysteine synthetase/decarboxylase
MFWNLSGGQAARRFHPALSGDHPAMRRILLVGGAPRVQIDAVRFLCVDASGRTAVRLGQDLSAQGLSCDLLLSVDAEPGVPALRFASRQILESSLKDWIGQNPDGVIVLSAAINDYERASVERRQGENVELCPANGKIPSKADEIIIRLRPASKVIDQLASWGHQGPLVGFKYEDSATVLKSARELMVRTNAAFVVANSLCGTVQTLVSAEKIHHCADREELLKNLGQRVAMLAAT